MTTFKENMVKLNHILLDILNWIRYSLQNKPDKKNKPYEILSFSKGSGGLLKNVSRETPRAVKTFIFTPINKKVEEDGTLTVKQIQDIHLCLDHLGALDTNYAYDPSIKRSALSKDFSHCITILKASRWLDKNGNYYTAPLFCEYYDFFPRSTGKHRDSYAIPIITDIANLLKNEYRLDSFDFHWEIQASQKRFMGGDYSYARHAPNYFNEDDASKNNLANIKQSKIEKPILKRKNKIKDKP